jgi:cobalamin synthase
VIWATKKIGGISGDILGAIEQVGEIVVFVVFAAMVTTYPIWW